MVCAPSGFSTCWRAALATRSSGVQLHWAHRQNAYVPVLMINALQSELTINVVASIIVSLLFLALGFLWGKYKERRRKFGRNLEEYRLLSVYRHSGEFW